LGFNILFQHQIQHQEAAPKGNQSKYHVVTINEKGNVLKVILKLQRKAAGFSENGR